MNISKQYENALTELRKLMKVEGAESVNRVFKETVSEYRRQTYLGRHKAEIRNNWHVCFPRLLGHGECPETNIESNTPLCGFMTPINDHQSEIVIDSKTKMIIAQPYEISETDLVDTLALCKKHDLQLKITAADSWHYPGRTLFVELTSRVV